MQKVYKASVVLIAAVLLTIMVFSGYAFFNTCSLVSHCEHRTLAPYPYVSAQAWFSGEFSLSLDSYLSDHVLLREELIPVTRLIQQLMRVQSRIRIIDIEKTN